MRLVIIGAGGHGRVVADAALRQGTYESVVFLDDAEKLRLDTYSVAGKVDEFEKFCNDSHFFVAVGDNKIRNRIQTTVKNAGGVVATIIHPSATIGANVEIGEGTVIMAGAVVNTDAKIGNGVIINTCSSVDHDCVLGDFCHVSVGAHIAGSVCIGKNTMVGAGAVVINGLSVCEDCILGAGAVAVKDITEPDVYVGVPASKMHKE